MKNKKNSGNNIDQILIVEDSPTQAEQLKHILEKHHYNVMVAKDGKVALGLVTEHKPILVISDILMPEMNGYELCKEIKSDEATMDIPVILLTSLSCSEDVLEGISCGADNFITKPYREDYLISHIEQILANRKINKNERVRVGVEILFGGKKRFITASQQQMLTLLISTYEAAVQRNNELTQTQDELKKLNDNLEGLVIDRTVELSEEIAVRKQKESHIVKLNRVYALLSNINQAIVRIDNKEQLLKDVCMIAVDEGKFLSAWIGIINDMTKKIEISASAGLTNDLIEVNPHKNPVFVAIETGKHFISNNIDADNAISRRWKKKSSSLGFKSFAAFPVKVPGKAKGSFCIYSNEVDFFDEMEISLLDEMSTDISFALEYIQKESERIRAEEVLHESELKYRQLFDDDLTGDFITAADGTILLCNPALARILGFDSADELMKSNIAKFYRNIDEREKFLELIRENKKVEQYEHELFRRDGNLIYAVENVIGEFDKSGKLVRLKGYMFDNTERKKAEERQKLTSKILAILNRANEWQQLIKDILTEIKEFTGLGAIGIRLKEGDDYPYFETTGFSKNFVEAERYLCARDVNGNIICDSKGTPYLECMCGNIISHRTDPKLPFFTKGGSFWSNSTTDLLASTTEEDRQTATRNRFNGAGYESVALIPLHSGDEIIGLLQLNDKRKNRLTSDLIRYFEELGSTIGIAFKRTQIEKQIKESEERFRLLSENAKDIIFRYEFLPVNKYSYISPAITEITGYAPAEFYADASLIFKLVHPDDLHLEKNVSESVNHPLVLRWIRKDGKTIWIDQRNVPIFDEQGNLRAIEGIARDITEQKQAADDLARERILLRTLIDNLPDNIYLKDTKMRKVLVNKADLALIGKTEEEVIGKDDSELYPEEVAGQFMADDRSVLEKGQSLLNREELLVNDLGKKIWLLTSKLPFYDHEGQIAGIIGIGHDITERKKSVELLKEREQNLQEKNEEYHKLNHEYLALNEELTESIERVQKMNEELRIAKEKAEESDKLKTAFLHNISHEIRTPLNGITGFSEMLIKQDLSSEKREQFSQIIRSSSDQLISIINDIISIATIEAGHEKPHEKETDINALLALIESQNSLNIKAKNLSFTVSSDLGDDEAIVLTDETKLLQILTNLVSNAIKFTPEGTIKVNCGLKGNFMQFTVKDTGIGIAPEMHERIFDRFFQIDHSDTRLYGGTGLGLSIVKSYVHFLNGEIQVDSKPGKGSVFIVSIPYKPVKYIQPANIPAHDDLKKIGPATILIAEDEPGNFELLNAYLSDFNLTIIHATDGLQAVKECKKNPSISLVLMDVKMPHMDGYEASMKIKKFRPHLPIIIQTAFIFQNEREKSLSAYTDGFIEKPINQRILMEHLYKHL